MANDEHVALLKKGVAAWNAWRDKNPQVRVSLSRADLSGAKLRGANLSGANLRAANLSHADFSGANLREANLSAANLSGANFRGANLSGAKLRGANFTTPGGGAFFPEADLTNADLHSADLAHAIFTKADLRWADLRRANLTWSDLRKANFGAADLTEADLRLANLEGADLGGANLSKADLREAALISAMLVETDLTGADLTDSWVYGVSAWNLKLVRAKQQNLIITNPYETEITNPYETKDESDPRITVDNLEVAQFIYLLLNNQKIRQVVDTITSKVVLLLGRFTDERKAVLDALRGELRKRDYVPILFDFKVPARRNFTETITLLARMARFIIADLTDPSSIPQELQAIIPSVRVPVQPLLLEGSPLFSMFKDFDPQDFHWVLPVYRYKEPEQLLASLAEKVIAPAEGKVKALEERRRMIEAELTKPQ